MGYIQGSKGDGATSPASGAASGGGGGPGGPCWSLEELLTVVARTRFLLCTYADQLCRQLDSGDSCTADKQPQQQQQHDGSVEAAVNELLLLSAGDEDEARNAPLVRSMRLFLLKQLERRRGVSFVRSALQQPPLSTSEWLRQWKQAADEPGLVRFVGENRLPRSNPLQALPHFSRLQALVDAFLTTGDAATLEQQLLDCRDQLGPGPTKAALGAAVFHECFLFSLLPDSAASTAYPRIAALKQVGGLLSRPRRHSEAGRGCVRLTYKAASCAGCRCCSHRPL